MKILVIGNGFVAAPIVRKLESEGHELLIYTRTYRQNIRTRQIVGDVLVFGDFEQVLKWKPQVIIQTAWVTTYGLYTNDQSNYKYAQFTSDLAKCVIGTEIEHLIILGTCAEYGPQTSESTAGITSLNPKSLYAEQKVVAFNSVRASLFQSDTRLTWARIFQPYGPDQDINRLLPYLIDSLNKGKLINLRDTSTILDWITNRDIASAISWILNNDTPVEVDLGTSFGYTNVELLKQLESSFEDSYQWERLAGQGSKGAQVSVAGKDSPLFKSGWVPKDSLSMGIEWVLNS